MTPARFRVHGHRDGKPVRTYPLGWEEAKEAAWGLFRERGVRRFTLIHALEPVEVVTRRPATPKETPDAK